MTTEETFLTAIANALWDDETIRLVYADWLDENGRHEEAQRQREWVPARRRLTEFASRYQVEVFEGEVENRPMTFEDVVQAGVDYLEHYAQAMKQQDPWHHNMDHYFPVLDSDLADREMRSNPSLANAFWRDWAIVTGRSVPEHAQTAGTPFHCGC